MNALILFGVFFVLLFLNVPIAISLGVSSIVTTLACNLSLNMVATNLYSASNKYVLLAIPFFILAGNIMEVSEISTKLIAFFKSLVGHTKHGLAMVCVVVACFFAAISGSGPATVAALGGILIPAMTNSGYDRSTSAALMSTAGAIGIVIPPSITFVVYGSVTGTSIGSLFISGIVPGIIIGIFIYYTMVLFSRGRTIVPAPKASGKERWAAFKDSVGGLLMPVIILGGIYGGIFTPTEAAAVSAIYGFIVGIFFYKTLRWKEIMKILRQSVSQTAVVMFIIGCAAVFGNTLTFTGIAAKASSALISIASGNKYIFLLMVNIILIIAGCFIDANSALYILCPILFPIAQSLGIDAVHLGAVMVVNLALGLITPPVGVNLFTGCGVAGISLNDMIRKIWPFVIAMLLVLLLITYVPAVSTFLPGLMK
ncbi:MAG: TRAP transporter large permease [Candidatus Limivicinus sp.]|nr:TRAP transporter large permease [Clostridiales bacterium]MDY6133657.1 TRAP transporter large permease [Candidatus Limivicinus sp.]